MTAVFISHSSKDSGFAGGVLKPLFESKGMTVWCASADMPAAVDWEKQILSALVRSDWYVVVLSPDAAESDWVRAEVHWALENRKGRVIPAMIRTCEPVRVHLKLGTIHYVDLRTDRAGGAAKLCSLIAGHPHHTAELTEEDTTRFFSLADSLGMINASFSLSIGFEPQKAFSVRIDRECVIGRANGVDLQINDSSISRRHARLSVILCDGDTYLQIEDLGSSNGLFINNRRIISPHRLKVGDMIGLGAARLLLKQCTQAA